ncbi:hypothetical protein PLICRDRAFT_65680, partial [Plicaturopsis crispa FD-325 SS-3]
HTSMLTGLMWMVELAAGHPDRFYTAMGMQKHVFRALLSELSTSSGLHDTKHVTAIEQLGIFLY